MRAAKILWCLPAVAASMLGCGGDGDADDMAEAVEALTGSPWQITSMVMVDGGGAEMDLFADWSSCARDNELTFSADGTFTLTEGAEACSVPVDASGTWELFRADDGEDLVTDVLLHNGESVGFGLHHLVTARSESEWTMELDRFDGEPGIVRYVIGIR